MNALLTALLLAAALVPPTPGAALDPGADLTEVLVGANAAYEAGEYGRAVEAYESAVARGVANGHLFFNLGNAYLRHGDLGRAVAAYRRARVLLPRDEDVAANLAFARKSARDALEPPRPSAVLTTLLPWHYGLSRSELLRLVAVLNLLFWAAVTLRLFVRRSEVAAWIAGALVAALLATGASLAVRHLAPRRIGVILPQEIDIHAGTSATSVVRFRLHAGTEVRATGRRDEWVRVELPDGESGWVEAEHVELVEL